MPKHHKKTKPLGSVRVPIDEVDGTEEIVGKHLCLNMIVKNESKVIQRMLESVAPYIDCYCICDTGSTDNTVEVIQSFFNELNPPIPGIVIREPFRDFGYNRTFALQACDKLDVEYVLLLDADMVLKVNPNMTREDIFGKLTDDVYYIFQGSDTFFYKNVRVVKNHMGISYWGVTHEYVKTPDGCRYNKFEKDEVFINDIGDGGCKSDKFIRDINLLKKGLEVEKNNDRYTFYLANSYRDAGQLDNAIDTYKKRIEIGGWVEEVWHSYYSIGKCYKRKGDMANAIYWWIEGYNFYQKRIENLFEIIHHYRCIGKNHIAYGFYNMAKNECKNISNDHLFLQKDIYDYKLDYELSIIGYYCNYNNYDLVECSMKLLNYPHIDDSTSRNVLSNYKFYTTALVDNAHISADDKVNIELLKKIGNTIPEIKDHSEGFYSSTPSMCLTANGELVVNVRLVNYWINDNGGYENPGNISTKNVVAVFDVTEELWTLKKEFIMNYDRSLDNLYVGLEDVRLHMNQSGDELMFNANRGLGQHQIVVEHGIVDINAETTVSGFVKMEGQREVEKNWVLFNDAYGNRKIIYNWSPLVIGDISDKKENGDMQFVKTHNIISPFIFKHLRGSTNGVTIGDEVWFICHTVSYEDRRYYYHMFVVLNAYTYEVKRYTRYFTFDKNKVEYTLGFTYFNETDQFMIGYSVMDKKTEYTMVDKSVIDEMMV